MKSKKSRFSKNIRYLFLFGKYDCTFFSKSLISDSKNPCTYHMKLSIIPYFHISKLVKYFVYTLIVTKQVQNFECASPSLLPKISFQSSYFYSNTIGTAYHSLSIDVFSCSGFYNDFLKIKFHVFFPFYPCKNTRYTQKNTCMLARVCVTH